MTKDVYGQKISYQFRKLPEDTDGLYHSTKKLVEVDSRLKTDKRQLTILHEELHAIFDVLGFSSVVNEDIEELIVDCVSRWVCEKYSLRPKK